MEIYTNLIQAVCVFSVPVPMSEVQIKSAPPLPVGWIFITGGGNHQWLYKMILGGNKEMFFSTNEALIIDCVIIIF